LTISGVTRMHKAILFFSLIAAAQLVCADEKVEAAIGGGAGGAVGAVIGEELGDRQGAIIGAGIGAAVGVAVATGGEKPESSEKSNGAVVASVDGHHPARHCPPGQAKKGRC
jgi:hypothetical protein